MTAVIFDYDWSLINCNSDTYIFHQLWPERPTVVEETYRDVTQQWTAAVDKSLELLQQTKPHLKAKDILGCVARVPVLEGMLQAAEYAHQQGAKLYIVSDANTMFIDAFLQEQNLEHLFETVVSNHAFIDDSNNNNNNNRLVVRPYHDFTSQPSHGCPFCPPNLCKGGVIQNELQIFQTYDRIIYVGDGGGDYCPAARLRKGVDTILVRQDYPLAKKISQHPIGADCKEWSTGKDVLRMMQELL